MPARPDASGHAQLVGKDMSDVKDPDRQIVRVEMVTSSNKSGNGFVDYVWPRPGSEKPQPKLSYVVGFAPWGWTIMTGVYVDDLTPRHGPRRSAR